MKEPGIIFDELRQRLAEGSAPGSCDETGVRRLWWAAMETLQRDLLTSETNAKGLWLATPLPALYEPKLLRELQGWVWAPEDLGPLAPMTTALPVSAGHRPPIRHGEPYRRLTLHADDSRDPLLIVITPALQVALALHGPAGKRQLLIRSDPTTLGDILALVGRGLQNQAPAMAEQLQEDLRQLGPLHTDEHLPQRFWPRLAERLTAAAPSLTLQTTTSPVDSKSDSGRAESGEELGLLEALSHEVRTPLATIRTLIRSLLRRRDLPAVVMKRLRQIDVECNEQIDRFGLIFHAAELQRQPGETTLARTDLGWILQSLATGWADQLDRRGILLALDLDDNLPEVLSDPGRLEPMLGGLIDRTSRGLPSGSQLLLLLRAAGARLKLQILVQLPGQRDTPESDLSPEEPQSMARVGAVLSWDPETGSLQLSQQATRQLLASLGGHYRQRRDRNITVFFPVASDAG